MGRTISGTLSSILAGAKRDLDYTLDLNFPATAYHFATSPLTAVNGFNYTAELESLSGIRQTNEAPTDNVSIGIQNLERVLSLHIAANWQLWRQATAVVGRNYYEIGSTGSRTGTAVWIEMFRGDVQRPNANDTLVTFDLIPDVISTGQIVCNRTLGPICPAVFKDAKTCGYSGGLMTCNHLLRSTGGCDGRANAHHFMGFEHRYAADYRVPGTGGNDDPGDNGGGGGQCPRVDQFTRVKGDGGEIIPKMVCFVTEEDEIWNPKLRRFFPIKKCTVARQQVIWELVTVFGAVGYSSQRHPIIRNILDGVGMAVQRFVPREAVLAIGPVDLQQTSVVIARECSHKGDVMSIEIDATDEDEKIYCYGDGPDKMIVCHNSKPPGDPVFN